MTITKDTPLTFGKNRGMTPAQLSLTDDGRNYLAWGCNALNNPAWRSAFSDALRTQPAEFDEAAVRKQGARYDDDPQDDFGRGQEAYVEQARSRFEINKREAQCFEKYAFEFGMDVKKLKSLWESWGGDERVSRKNFSNDAKWEAWQRMSDELNNLAVEWGRA